MPVLPSDRDHAPFSSVVAVAKDVVPWRVTVTPAFPIPDGSEILPDKEMARAGTEALAEIVRMERGNRMRISSKKISCKARTKTEDIATQM